MPETNLNNEEILQETQDAGAVLIKPEEGAQESQDTSNDPGEMDLEMEDVVRDFQKIMENTEAMMNETQVLASSEEIAEISGEVLASSEEMLEFFQKGWEDFLEVLVEKVARKAGYMDDIIGGHKEYLENAIILQRKRLERRLGEDLKGRLRPRETPFVEDIKAYFRHSVQTLMEERRSEEEAFRVIWNRVERAILKEPDFDSFVRVFDGFWSPEYLMWDNMQAHHGELIGLFYSGFLLLGITLGSLLGYLLGGSLGEGFLGCGVGVGLGLSCGVFTHAFLRRAHTRESTRGERL